LLHQFADSLPFKQGKLGFYGEYIGNPKSFTGNFYFRGEMDSLNVSGFLSIIITIAEPSP
jgi:hypothetical protein